MIEIRPGCECCDRDLPPDSRDARICTFECTFCAGCTDRVPRRDVPELRRRTRAAADPAGGDAGAPSGFHQTHLQGRRLRDARQGGVTGDCHRGNKMIRKTVFGTVFLVAGTLPAFAHLNPLEHGSFAAGFSHPLFGTDHILAMVAVGLWAALLGGRALWMVPAAFVGTMIAGFVAALAGAPLPFVEPAILASVVVIGLLAAVALDVRVGVAMAMVGFFAFFHGHAHGGEIGEAGAGAYAAGFALATALLHAAGVALGLGLGVSLGGRTGRMLTRITATVTALGGLWLATGG